MENTTKIKQRHILSCKHTKNDKHAVRWIPWIAQKRISPTKLGSERWTRLEKWFSVTNCITIYKLDY